MRNPVEQLGEWMRGNNHHHETHSHGTEIEVQSSFSKEGNAWQLNTEPGSPLNRLNALGLGQLLPTRFTYEGGDVVAEKLAVEKTGYMRSFFMSPEVLRELESGNADALLKRVPGVEKALQEIEQGFVT